jgi:putative transposase
MNMNNYFVRKTNRIPLQEIYQKGNGYFVTICVQDRQCIFDIPNQNHISKIVIHEWQNIMNFYDNVILDEFILMPNHFHGIIIFDGIPKQKDIQKIVSLGDIISRFKNDTRRHIVKYVEEGLSLHGENIPNCNNGRGNGETGLPPHNPRNLFPSNFNYHKIWQKSYYDHIIRNYEDLDRIREYIVNNPAQWELDELNPLNNP